jgi:hypothetical protein
MWRGQSLAAARADNRNQTLRRERSRRARLAAELADRQLYAPDPSCAGSSLPLALSLYREAAYWALRAHDTQHGATSLHEALRLGEAAVAQCDLSDEELATVRRALADKTFVESADERTELLRRETELAQRLVQGLVSGADSSDPVAGTLMQRWQRTGLLLAIALCGLIATTIVIQRWWQGPDLALGKPWRSSSQEFVCEPTRNTCGGAQTNIFFHTREEESPWLEIDLGSAQSFARIQVTNRDDCCIDRAVPLLAEVSSDREHWREVAREPDSFRQWEATFPATSARYVRVRVDRHTILHLARVSIRAR